ncbi:TonB family protein [Pseudomonadales bacterium]|nr:TonB family protein [Pseudomonadales bacterium]
MTAKDAPKTVERHTKSEGRMGFSVFLALLVHGILLFGIGVSQFEPSVQPAYITLELGLSGDSSTQQTAVTAPLTENLDSPAEAAKSLGKEKVSPETTVTKPTETTQRFKELNQTTTQQSERTFNSRDAVEAFAKFQASIDSQRPTSQGLSRTRELNSLSKFTAPETAYLNTWRRKCERIGRNNYPPGILEGELTMLVSILRDGSLASVKILRSSGQPKLDEAALATVRQAAPFQPFTVEMRKSYDRLEFTRTWQFSKQGTGVDY